MRTSGFREIFTAVPRLIFMGPLNMAGICRICISSALGLALEINVAAPNAIGPELPHVGSRQAKGGEPRAIRARSYRAIQVAPGADVIPPCSLNNRGFV